MEIVRKLWTSVEANAEEREQAKLKQDIAQSVERLKGRIEKSLRAPRPPIQRRLLFNGLAEVLERPSDRAKGRPGKPRFTEPIPRICDKDLVEHALTHRPGGDADLLDWLRQCRRAGLYEQGKAISEKGGLNLANLTDEQQIEAEDDYRICVRRGIEHKRPNRRSVSAKSYPTTTNRRNPP